MRSILIKNPNLNAKLKGMYRKRITKEDIDELIKQNSVKNVVLLLKSKSDIFKNADENIDRLEIESLLEKSQIEDILKIKHLINKKDEQLFDLFLLQYEIKLIKSILRKLYANNNTNDIIIQNVKNWNTTLFEDIKGIETVQNFEQFFLAIKRMKYNEILKDYKSQENINIFEMENQMDKFYFETLYDQVSFDKDLKKIVGSEIDLLNILWIFRIKKYYKFDNQKVKDILINRNYRLNSKNIEKLLNINSFEDVKIVMQNTVYKKIFTTQEELEDNIDKFLYNINKKVFKQNHTSIAYIFAYINLIDYENNDIINTLEAIRYNIPKEELYKRLIR